MWSCLGMVGGAALCGGLVFGRLLGIITQGLHGTLDLIGRTKLATH